MHWQTKHVFLACHDCGVLHPVEPIRPAWFDDVTQASADYASFVADHAAHRTAWLVRQDGDTASNQPFWDPMATLTFQATDGREHYIVTARRESIDDPRAYRFARGELETRSSEVVVDDHDLRRGLDRQFFPHALRPTQVDRFISIVHEVVSHIPPDNLEIAFDVADDPTVSVARMPTESYQELLVRCTEIFDLWEWPRVSRFLSDNRGEDGLLALRVRRQVSAITA
jgi:hypothetical protein